MTTFSTRVLQCPNCENKMYTYQLNSYTVFKSTVYSDGKIISNPPVMHDKRILICSECKKPFWTEDALLEGEDYDFNNDELPNANDIHDLPFAFDTDFSIRLAKYYSDLLNQGFANSVDREVYLRIELWQLLNNNIRNKSTNKIRNLIKGIVKESKTKNNTTKKTDNTIKLFYINLKKLIKLYEPNNDNELLLLVEMHRELGNFSEASLVLKKIEDIDNNVAYKEISRAIKIKNPEVFKII